MRFVGPQCHCSASIIILLGCPREGSYPPPQPLLSWISHTRRVSVSHSPWARHTKTQIQMHVPKYLLERGHPGDS